MRRSENVTILLLREEKAALDEWCARTRIPKSVFLREATKLALTIYKDHKEGESFP